MYGFPTYDISEVVNPAGEEEYEQLLDELNTMRNALYTDYCIFVIKYQTLS